MAKEQLKRLQKQRVKIDRRVTLAITMGGWLVLVTLLALVWHLLSVTRPILDTQSFELDYQITPTTQNPVVLVEQLDNIQWYFALDRDCNINAFQEKGEHGNLQTILSPDDVTLFPHHCAATQKLVSSKDGIYLLRLSSTGILRIFKFREDEQSFSEQVFSTLLPEILGNNGLEGLQAVLDEQHLVLLARDEDGIWRLIKFHLKSRDMHLQVALPLELTADVEAQRANNVGRQVQPNLEVQLLHSDKLDMVYSAKQLLLLDDSNTGQWQVFREVSEPDILALTVLSTQRSILLMNGNLQLEKWAIINQNGNKVLQQIYTLPLQGRSFRGMTHVSDNLTLVLVDDKAWFINATTGEVLNVENHQLTFDRVWFPGESVLFERKDIFVSMNIVNASATISFESLWGTVWYDGYPEPDYVWQTSSASDDQQAKYSLMPLVMGSVKAAFLALVVAIPLAIGSAVYSGYYAAPGVRKIIKPYIEILEAIPSVVIGFIAVIWFLPVSENYLLAMLLFFVLTPLFLLLFVWLNDTGRHLNVPGWELAFFGAILLCYFAIFQLLLMDNQQIMSWLLDRKSVV